MDMQMPVMDGLEATAIIRKQLKSDIPIIALTANAIKGENDRCIAAGMNDYISKPFDEDTLVNIMAKWLGDKSSATESRVLIEAVKLYDLSRLRELSMGNEEFVRKMIILLEKEIPVVLAELQEGFEENDFAKMASAAHRVRPSLDYMGVDSLKSKINKIERLAREKQYSDQFPLLIREVGDTLRKVRIGLQNEKL
jgi:response regulator RpfG family c-di-GMP phosphodiesterase